MTKKIYSCNFIITLFFLCSNKTEEITTDNGNVIERKEITNEKRSG
jgi:hypothetical protein